MTEVTTLRPGWRMKMLIFIGAFLGFGAWGYYDATIAYPARGLKIASIRELEFLREAQRQRGRLDPAELSVPDPKDRLEQLERGKDRLGQVDAALYLWLDALNKAWRLSPERTTYNNSDRLPSKRLEELDAQWKGTPALPKAVNALDIFIQWVIFFGCIVFALAGFVTVAMVWRRPFRFDPESLSLTLPKVTPVDQVLRGVVRVLRGPWTVIRMVLFRRASAGQVNLSSQRIPAPGGQVIAPADLEEVDKTNWSRFWVSLRIKPGHATLGGKAVAIDLYRRSKLEEWVLAMEKQAFPEASTETGAAAPAAAS